MGGFFYVRNLRKENVSVRNSNQNDGTPVH